MKTIPVTKIFKKNKTYGCWAIEGIYYQQIINSDDSQNVTFLVCLCGN